MDASVILQEIQQLHTGQYLLGTQDYGPLLFQASSLIIPFTYNTFTVNFDSL